MKFNWDLKLQKHSLSTRCLRFSLVEWHLNRMRSPQGLPFSVMPMNSSGSSRIYTAPGLQMVWKHRGSSIVAHAVFPHFYFVVGRYWSYFVIGRASIRHFFGARKESMFVGAANKKYFRKPRACYTVNWKGWILVGLPSLPAERNQGI